jgi:hypothetical protein
MLTIAGGIILAIFLLPVALWLFRKLLPLGVILAALLGLTVAAGLWVGALLLLIRHY